jgi:hypothetical protein
MRREIENNRRRKLTRKNLRKILNSLMVNADTARFGLARESYYAVN